MKRRGFVVGATAASLSAGLALWFRARGSDPELSRRLRLIEDPDGILDLLPGFRYRILERYGEAMSDGYRVPAGPDAMGCFATKTGSLIIMRNHELDRAALSAGPYPQGVRVPDEAYDPYSAGCVTRLVLDRHGERISSNLVLTGTSRNCAGGISPWGWLSCEETVEPGHGYVFLCSIAAETVRPPQRITAYGRFRHEAVAIDPDTHSAYLTEDRPDGCLYRFVPNDREQPFGAGRLQAMMVDGAPGFSTGDQLTRGAPRTIKWLDLPPDLPEDEDGLRAVAQASGAATVRRGEGIWRASDAFYITATTGGPRSNGQILRLVANATGGALSVIAQADAHTHLDMPDNITVTPWGDLLVCEDNQRVEHMHLVTKSGKVVPFARNAASRSEFAGACFSPDGRFAFVNIQENGLTLAIEGPFAELSRRAAST